ncbi:MAG: glucose-6-phosphate isomerase family protein [Candidatus Omnitrophica bacterium]|nr:glucose-6-phosphate isomerase family protein [Candidatus Omnitrophota bacterium]MDD5355562.1 glucose-6-phosphate isomerase family protein [Candidatus Omnitrophota bacterium]
MIDLINFVGLDIKFDENKCSLSFNEGVTEREPAVRTIEQMKEVLADESVSGPEELYYMYRNIHAIKDDAVIKQHKLRFDITIIKPDMLGNELMKTAGHYHPKSYPELYEVVYGEALCLQQRYNKNDFRKIEEVIVVRAKQGQKIVCLPHFGHILINSGNKPLITSNWVSSEFSSEYDLYKESKGAAYYAFSKDKNIEWSKNNFFTQVPDIAFLVPNDEIREFGLKTGVPMYSLIKDLKNIDFLNNPDKYRYNNVFKK